MRLEHCLFCGSLAGLARRQLRLDPAEVQEGAVAALLRRVGATFLASIGEPSRQVCCHSLALLPNQTHINQHMTNPSVLLVAE